MRTLDRYLARLFALRFLLFLAGITSALLTFDTLANVGDVVAGSRQVLVPVLSYISLRLPIIVSVAIPLAVLAASMATLIALHRHREIDVMRASGVSARRLLPPLLLVAGGIVIAQIWFEDRLAVPAASSLSNWREQGYRTPMPPAPLNEAAVWLADDTWLIHFRKASLDGRELFDVTLVEQVMAESLPGILKAERAVFDGNDWVLLLE